MATSTTVTLDLFFYNHEKCKLGMKLDCDIFYRSSGSEHKSKMLTFATKCATNFDTIVINSTLDVVPSNALNTFARWITLNAAARAFKDWDEAEMIKFIINPTIDQTQTENDALEDRHWFYPEEYTLEELKTAADRLSKSVDEKYKKWVLDMD